MATVEEHPATNGTATAAGDIAVENPATGEVIAHVPDTTAEQVAELARARARRAAGVGGARLRGPRSRSCAARRSGSSTTPSASSRRSSPRPGKAYEDALIAEVMYARQRLRLLGQARSRPTSPTSASRAPRRCSKGKRMVLRYRPLGLVGVIGPWNYPLTNSFGDSIPALAAGNAVILKPSEVTPLTSLLMADALRECGLPDGVFAVATGAGATGAALVDAVDMIMFTGSTATGKKVMAKAAETLTPVSLELGGKDPMIVLADADVERAANAAVYYAMLNGGQTCVSVERVYVEAPVYDEFVAKVTEKARALRNDRSTGPGTADVGSMTFPPQVDIVERHVRDAVDKGARVVVGGERGHDGQGGYWFEPTVLVDVDHTMDCMREETFGPTLPIMKVADAEEAIRLANDSPYGLGGSVFSKDVARGEAVARRIEAGAVCVNDSNVNYAALELPMGGAKASGLGSRHGADGIRKYTQQQALLISRVHPKRDLHMYPYSARMTGVLGKLVRVLYGRGKRD